jgi:hypothetical protein
MEPIVRESFVERRQSYLRWGAIAAGIVSALAVWLTLQLLGVGAGLASIDVDDAGSLHGAGIGAGVWSVLAPLLALGAGGFVAVTLARTWSRNDALFHAIVVWAVTALIGTFAIVAVTAEVVGASLRATGYHDGGAVSLAPGDADDLVGVVNDRLAARGKPALPRGRAQVVLHGAIRRSVHSGFFDAERATEEIQRQTDLDRPDATDVAAELQRRWNDRTAAMRGRDRETLEAADTAGKTMLGAGIALLLSLGTAIGGALLALRRLEKSEPDARSGPRFRRAHTAPGPAPIG